LSDGALVLAAGNWATTSPGVLNPSYWALPVLTDLGRLTGDTRWTQIVATSVRVMQSLTTNGTTLPPDWAHANGASASAAPNPGGQPADVRYSFDAQRAPVWFALGGHDA